MSSCLADLLCTYQWENSNWVLASSSQECNSGDPGSKYPCRCLTAIEAQALGLLPTVYRNCAPPGQPQQPCSELLGCYQGTWEEMENKCTKVGSCGAPAREGTYIDESVSTNCQCTSPLACGQCKYQWVVVPGNAGKWVEYEVTGDCEFSQESAGCGDPTFGDCEYRCTKETGSYQWLLSSNNCASPCSCPNDYNSAFGPCTAAEEGLVAMNFCGYKCICPGEPDGDGTSSGQIYTSDCTDDYGSSSAFTLTSLYTSNFETYPEAKEFSNKLQDLSFYSEVADIKNKLSFKPIEFQQKTLFIKDLNLRLTNEEKTANVKEIPFVDHEIKFNDKETKIYKIREKKHDAKPDLSDIFGDDNGNKK
jgi:hypothetical protein